MENVELYKNYDKNNNLNCIKTIDNIDDFIKAISVFKLAPYYEILNKEDCECEYNSYIENGLALGFYVDNKIAGLNCILYDSDKKHSICFSDEDKVVYYSGLAVIPEYRKLGIGKLLVHHTDEFIKSFNEFNYSYARILLYKSMSEGIFRKYGFNDVYVDNELIVDEVTYKRNIPNIPETDERKYMVKQLSNKANKIIKR